MNPADLTLDVLGLGVVLRSPDARVAGALAALFGPFRATTMPGRRVEMGLRPAADGWEMTVDAIRLAAGPDWRGLLPGLVTEINHRAIHQVPWLGIHAGVVTAGAASFAFPGESGRGKSTAVAACVAAGLEYVSDEALIVDSDGRIVPYPRPISLAPAMAVRIGLPVLGGTTDEVLLDTRALTLAGSATPRRLAHVILLHRGAAAENLTELSPAVAATELLSHSFNHYRDPAAALRLCTDAARGLRCWRFEYADPEQVAGLVVRLTSHD